MRNFKRGETITAECRIKAYDPSSGLYAYADPDTGYPKITIIDPDGVTVVNNIQMTTKISTGRFQYDYTTLTTASAGWYTIVYKAAAATRLTEFTDGFNVE